jgi:hypothetical protein
MKPTKDDHLRQIYKLPLQTFLLFNLNSYHVHVSILWGWRRFQLSTFRIPSCPYICCSKAAFSQFVEKLFLPPGSDLICSSNLAFFQSDPGRIEGILPFPPELCTLHVPPAFPLSIPVGNGTFFFSGLFDSCHLACLHPRTAALYLCCYCWRTGNGIYRIWMVCCILGCLDPTPVAYETALVLLTILFLVSVFLPSLFLHFFSLPLSLYMLLHPGYR